MKHYSSANQVFLASHSRRQVPSSLINFLYINFLYINQFPLYKGKNTAKESIEVLMGCQKRLTQVSVGFSEKGIYTSISFLANKDLSFATLYATIDLSILKSTVTAHMHWNPITYAI